jgi:hypothetical protein
MSEIYACIFCAHANPLREKDGKIRCERFSEWHDPIQTIKCEGFIDKGAGEMMEIVGRLKSEQT